jgi:serine protease Do
MRTRIDNPFNWLIVLAVMFLGLSIAVGLRTTSPSLASQVSGVSGKGSASSSLTIAHELSDAFATVAEAVNPSVVTIFTETDMERVPLVDSPYREFFSESFFERFFENNSESLRSEKQMGLGSGVIVDRDGIILTNNHVVDDADQISVRLMDGREFEAKVQGADPQTDLAVISIDAHDLVSAELGDADQSRVGEWVLAIGSPLDANLDHTVTSGIISAKGRSGVGLTQYEDFIQTDAAINPGNSGGVLVDLNGKVIGINTAIATRNGGNMGIGFAIPANLARRVMADIIEKGTVERGWLGVHIQTMSHELARAFGLESSRGVVVSHVQGGSPADKAGLKPEDVVVGFEGKDIDNAVELSTLVAGTSPGTHVQLDVVRDGKKKSIVVTLAELNPTKEQRAENELHHEDMGFTVSGITPGLAEDYRLPEEQKGVVITDVASNSIASEAGLREGDVVLELNREPVQTVGDFEEAMRSTTAGDNALFYVQRGEARVFVASETSND